jgi:exonuclease SbcC
VITGPNDSGKSNLLRAINWVINNRPTGDDFFPNCWEGSPHVILDIGGKLVERKKSKNENIYILEGEKEPFKSFGKGIPEIIKNHLNMSSININFQLDGPFLLGKSAADVARHYNELVNLEIIDRAIKNINRTITKERTSLKTEQEVKKQKIEDLKAFDWVSEAEKDLSDLEKQNNHLKKLRIEWSDLAGWIRDIDKLKELDLRLSDITQHEKEVKILSVKKDEITVQKMKCSELSTLIQDFKSLSDESKELKNIIGYQNKVTSLIEKINKIDNMLKDKRELTKYINQLKQYKETEIRYRSIIKYTDDIKALLVLDREIEKDIIRYNLLQDLLDKWISLDQKYKNIEMESGKLQNKFVQLMPDQCPIFDIPCDHIHLQIIDEKND